MAAFLRVNRCVCVIRPFGGEIEFCAERLRFFINSKTHYPRTVSPMETVKASFLTRGASFLTHVDGRNTRVYPEKGTRWSPLPGNVKNPIPNRLMGPVLETVRPVCSAQKSRLKTSISGIIAYEILSAGSLFTASRMVLISVCV